MLLVKLYSRELDQVRTYYVWSKVPMHSLGHHYKIEATVLFNKAFGLQLDGYPESLPPFILSGVDWHPFTVDASNSLASYERLTSEAGVFNHEDCFIVHEDDESIFHGHFHNKS